MNQVLQQPDIDYSSIETSVAVGAEADWEAPRKVFFGRRDPNTGRMEKEPVYKHQDFPCIMYKLIDGRIRAKMAQNDAEREAAYKGGYEDTPAEFGYVGAPSRQQLEEAEEQARKARAAAQTAKVTK